MNIIFFGSTTDSIIVLNKLCHVSGVTCQAVVTQPAKPVGRKQILTSTPVEILATAHHIPVLSFPSSLSHPSFFQDDQTVIDTLQPFKVDLLVSASFGQRIPIQAIQAAPFGGLNVHPSLLPRWRGADPVPWAILSGDAQTGVTIVTLSETFDQGAIIAQKKIPITDADFSDPLRTKLFEIGAELLIEILPNYLSHPQTFDKKKPRRNFVKTSPAPYAKRFTRQDGFEPWETIHKAFKDPEEARRIDRKFRALTPWPGVWTEVSVRQRARLLATERPPATHGEALRAGSDGGQVNASAQTKRVKIISLHRHMSGNDTLIPHLILDSVQLEGKKPVSFSQFKEAYLPSLPS